MLPRFRRGAFALFAVTFLVTMLLGDRGQLSPGLTLQPDEVLAGHGWWTPVTALFRHPEGVGLLGLLWTLAIQWLLGSRLDGFWGTARYLIMVLVAGVVGYGALIGLALIPAPVAATIAQLDYSGPGPMDTAAAVAFGWVFARERMQLGSAELPPLPVAGIAALIGLGFPLIVALAAGTPIAAAWPTLLPGVFAALVATVFVQPWRKPENSGKVERKKPRDHPHLRVVRTPEDMLN